jgi:hypothetical protein
MPNYVFVIIRLKMSHNINALSGGLVCHQHGNSDDVYPIGGLVEPEETLMASAIRHCCHIMNYCVKPSDRLYLTKVLSGVINHETVKISIYVTNVFSSHLRWRGRHSTRVMAIHVVDHLNPIEESYEGLPGPLPPVEIPTSLTIETPYGDTEEFSIYQGMSARP